MQKAINNFATNVTRLSLHVGTLRHTQDSQKGSTCAYSFSHSSPVTCHVSLTPTATGIDPPPVNSPIMDSRLVCKESAKFIQTFLN